MHFIVETILSDLKTIQFYTLINFEERIGINYSRTPHKQPINMNNTLICLIIFTKDDKFSKLLL